VTDGEVAELPVELQVEVTAACNLRCRMCLVSYRKPVDRVRGSVGLDELRQLLDAVPSLERLTLQGLGEPLLAPDIEKLVREARDRGIEVGFNTNGVLLDERRASLLVGLGIDWVHVSLDAASERSFEAIRAGASFDRVVRNLRGLVELRSSWGARKPSIQLNAVLMRRTLRELIPLVRLASEIGVDRLWVQQLSHDLGDTEGDPAYAGMRRFVDDEILWGDDREVALVRHMIGAARRLAGELGLDVRLPEPEQVAHPPGALPCDWPWRSSYVNHDGRVQPCCMVMGSERSTMGNALEEGFENVWNGERYVEFRRRLLSDDPPEVCQGCAHYRGTF
jgi:radical SAM protein with 4Fe4S-binding SPASM domain